MDPVFWARYPFLPGAREHIRSQGYAVGELVSDPAYAQVRRRAFERVRAALGSDGIPEAAIAHDAEAEREILSYPVARVILSHLGDAYTNSRYAVAESKLASGRLAAEESEAAVWSVLEGLELPVTRAENGDAFARIHFLDYLRHAPTRDPSWKLVNQPVSGGSVELTRERAIRLAEEALRERLLDEFEVLKKPGKEIAQALGADLTQLTMTVAAQRARFQEQQSGEIRVEAFPPCMKAIWTGIQNHVNIPHMGRLAIVTFLHKQGMDSEEILKFFSQVPDFSVEKSRYQIEHITGKIGGGTEYTTPSCATMQTYGICPLELRDDICLNEIKNPLGYYRKKLRRIPPAKPKPAAPTSAPPAPEAADG